MPIVEDGVSRLTEDELVSLHEVLSTVDSLVKGVKKLHRDLHAVEAITPEMDRIAFNATRLADAIEAMLRGK